MSAVRYARIAGTGSYLPEQRVSNQDLVARLAKQGLETSDEWIKTRSGTQPLMCRLSVQGFRMP